MTDTTWFVQGRDDGPVDLGALAALARSGGIAADTPVREAEGGEWTAASELLPALFAAPGHAKPTGWTDRSPHPWRRYAARLTDNMVVGLLTWWIIGLVFYSVAPAQADAFFLAFTGPGGNLLDGLLTLICAIPGNAAMIGLTGLSIGKWIFGIRVLGGDGRPIGFPAALVRELDIWLRGLAGGLPLISLATLIMSYGKLTETRTTVWDKRQGNVVVHRPSDSTVATIGMIFAVVVLIAGLVALRVASISPPA